MRLKLLKVAGQVRVSVRRVYVQLSSAYPLQALFRLVPSAADGLASRQRLTPPFPCRHSFHAGGVGKNRRQTYS